MKLKTLENIDKASVLECFNLSFSDYFVDVQLSGETFNSKIVADKINLALSVGVFEEGKLIAFILHGNDIIEGRNIVYNAGTGVVPEKRGKGLTKLMYDYVLPILQEQKVHQIQLEVISKNKPAIKAYEGCGFKTIRELACYTGTILDLQSNHDLEIRQIGKYDWDLLETFWNTSPTWQNSKNIVTELIGANISWGAYLNKCLVGYLIYNPSSKKVLQIAVDKNCRNIKVASTLFKEIQREFDPEISIINVDKSNSDLNIFLEKIGLTNFIEQIEMTFSFS